jgi:AraC-like DNA-binding protein
VAQSGPDRRFAQRPLSRERRSLDLLAGRLSVLSQINLGKRAVASQGNLELMLNPGDAVPLLTHEPAALTTTHHLGVLVPRSALAARLGNVDDAGMRMVPRSSEAMRLIRQYMRTVYDRLALATPVLRDLVVGHVHDLIAVALTAPASLGESRLSAIADARLNAALGYIASHFEEPGLTIADVAHEQGVSPRHLQRIMESAGMTFTGRVTELRLQRALALLREQHGRERRIADVALQVGFSDISYFNRQFRSRFGDTPRGVLAQHAAPRRRKGER